MKFIAKKGAPDVPLEILEAQESDQLVLFCGAGISCPAGLPSFGGLTKNVYDELSDSPTKLEKEAQKSGFFDRTFNLLERRYYDDSRIDKHLVRKAIIKCLSLDTSANVETHKAILQLSKTKADKIRLVTTNFDRGFILANPSVREFIDSAPKLPVPKQHRWGSLVHLHGLINDSDPNGEHLVVTSGDFGAAYLTERWASKFVSELFRHFVVLFIGYSIDDPVIRYMTDAIAADRRRGDEDFHEPYVLAGTTPKKWDSDFEIWTAKGVKPILYDKKGTKHSFLHRTLKEWAAYCRDGLRGKARIIEMKATIPPLPPYQNESILQVIDTLREKTAKYCHEVTGYPSEVFCKLDSPPAPIEWLPLLDKEGLLRMPQQNENVFPVAINPVLSNLTAPNKITFNLWSWLSNNLEKKELVAWVIDNGSCLHPHFIDLIERKLHSPVIPKEPYLTFWRVVTSDFMTCEAVSGVDGHDLLKSLDNGIDSLVKASFKKLITPKIKLSKAFSLPDDSDETLGDQVNQKPYDAEVVIALSDVFGELEQKDNIYPASLVPLLMDVTTELKQALDFWELLGHADKHNDRSYWDLSSISPHPQNHRYHSWSLLIELCRDIWMVAWEEDRRYALSVLKVWQSIEYPAFTRLTFHAIATKPVLSIDESLDYLLRDDAWWLWSVATFREQFRLLANLWQQLSKDDAEKLTDIIIDGPPREMFRKDLELGEWDRIRDRNIWLHLAKLESFGRDLGTKGKEVLQSLASKYPQWSLQEGDRDEFTHWMGDSKWGHDVDIHLAQLFSLSVEEIIEKLTETNQFHEGRIDLFRNGCKEDYTQANVTLTRLHDNAIWDRDVWHAGLVGLADSEKSYWPEISAQLLNAPNDFFVSEAWAISHWIKKAAKEIIPETQEENLFWRLFEKVFDAAQDQETCDFGHDIINKAINHPFGMMAEALLDRFFNRKIEKDKGIQDKNLLFCLEKILNGEGTSYILAKVILASRLHYFFSIDPNWTKSNLLPLMDWDSSAEAPHLWAGYLWAPRIFADLALEIKDSMLAAISHADQLTKNAERLYQIFVVVCLNYQDLFSIKHKRLVLKSLNSDGRASIASFLSRSLRSDKQNKEEFWENRIKPFIKQAWPKDGVAIHQKTSESFALLCIQLSDLFEDAVNTIKPVIGKFLNLGHFFHVLERSELLNENPLKVFDLLASVFTPEYQWPRGDLRNILQKLIENAPEILEDPRYQEIDTYLLGKGL